MEELKAIGTYQEFKKALDAELYNQAEGFVRTGYLLKVARDTDILRESGYVTVAEFAHAEYGLTKDVVSRYIAINDRYSEGGYSEKLQAQYQGYGVAKLQDMLTLPDAIIEVMSPEMTRKEIQEVKREYKGEISNSEESSEMLMCNRGNMNMLQQAIYQYLYDNRAEFTKGFNNAMRSDVEHEAAVSYLLDALVPSGIGVKTVRIQGIGRIMISFRGKETEIEVLNVRTQERESYSWQKFIAELREIFAPESDESGREMWERIYGEAYNVETVKVAPVQLDETIPEKEKEIQVQNTVVLQVQIPKKEKVKKIREEIKVVEVKDRQEQIPGQTSIEKDFKEFLPERNVVNEILSDEPDPDVMKQYLQDKLELMSGLVVNDDWKVFIDELENVLKHAVHMLRLQKEKQKVS